MEEVSSDGYDEYRDLWSKMRQFDELKQEIEDLKAKLVYKDSETYARWTKFNRETYNKERDW